MQITFRRVPRLVRLCATFALLHGLYDSLIVFGLSGDAAQAAATAQFTFFAGFVISRIIAAVGLWLLAPWGGVVLLFTLLSELSILAVASGLSQLTWFDVGLRLVELALLALVYRQAWATSSQAAAEDV